MSAQETERFLFQNTCNVHTTAVRNVNLVMWNRLLIFTKYVGFFLFFLKYKICFYTITNQPNANEHNLMMIPADSLALFVLSIRLCRYGVIVCCHISIPYIRAQVRWYTQKCNLFKLQVTYYIFMLICKLMNLPIFLLKIIVLHFHLRKTQKSKGLYSVRMSHQSMRVWFDGM